MRAPDTPEARPVPAGAAVGSGRLRRLLPARGQRQWSEIAFWVIAAGVRRGRVCAAKVFGAVGFARLIAFGAWRVRPDTEVRAKTDLEEASLRRRAERTTRVSPSDAAQVRYGRSR